MSIRRTLGRGWTFGVALVVALPPTVGAQSGVRQSGGVFTGSAELRIAKPDLYARLTSETGLEANAVIAAAGIVPRRGTESLAGSYEPVVARLSMAQAVPLVQNALAGFAMLSGSVARRDAQGKSVLNLDFDNSILSRIELPALDAASKDACVAELTLAIGSLRSGSAASTPAKDAGGRDQAECVASDFKITIPGMDLSRVMKVEGLAMSRAIDAADVSRAGAWQFDPVKLIMPEAAAQAVYAKWQGDAHKSAGDRQKLMMIEFMKPALTAAVFTLTMRVALVGVHSAANGDVQLELAPTQWQLAAAK